MHTLAPASSDRRCLKAGQAAAWLGRGLRLPTPTRSPQLALPPGGLRGGARRCLVPFSGHFTTHGSSPPLRCALPPLWQGKPNIGREGAAGGPGILPGASRGTAMGRRSLFAVQNLGRHTWAQQNNPHRLCCSSQPKITTDEGRRLSGMH